MLLGQPDCLSICKTAITQVQATKQALFNTSSPASYWVEREWEKRQIKVAAAHVSHLWSLLQLFEQVVRGFQSKSKSNDFVSALPQTTLSASRVC